MRYFLACALLVLFSTFIYAQEAAPPSATGRGVDFDPDRPDYIQLGAPRIDSVDPDRGLTAGGTTVTVTGKRFTFAADMTVFFGDDPATGITVVNPRTLTCVTPAHAAGLVDITLSTSFGSDSLIDGFTYYDPPELTGIAPVHGTVSGGTAVTLTGNHFTFSADTTVTFGGAPASNVVVVDSMTVTCDTPSHAAGLVDVTLTNGNGSDTLTNAFTYHNAPAIASIDPTSGPDSGGTAVTIYGSDFTTVGATLVAFDGLAATSIVVVDATTITCNTPAHPAGVVDVMVTNDFGSDTLSNGYTYTTSAPIIFVPGDYPTIQQAVDAAVDGETILVAPGTYDENLQIPAKDVIIRTDEDGDPGTIDLSPETTFIDGNQSGRVVTFQGGTGPDVTLRGFTIVNGYDTTFSFAAGGIYCDTDSSPTITDNIIIGNACDFGAGGLKTESENASHVIANNIISGNYSHFGGSGGVMIVGTNSSHTLLSNYIAGNRSEATCGGLTTSGVTCTHSVVNNIIAGNAGVAGGGISVGGWDANDIYFLNNTVIDNYASETGGGMAIGGWLMAECINTILYGNSAPEGPEISMSTAVLGTSELDISYCDVEGGQAMVHVEPTCTLSWGANNITSLPGLNTGPSGTWTSAGVYDPSTYQLTLTDASASWTPDEHAGKMINPDVTQELKLFVVSNSTNTMNVWGDWQTITAGSSWVPISAGYEVEDGHLTSGSNCIDLGYVVLDLPDTDIDGDDRVINGDVDMGADEFKP